MLGKELSGFAFLESILIGACSLLVARLHAPHQLGCPRGPLSYVNGSFAQSASAFPAEAVDWVSACAFATEGRDAYAAREKRMLKTNVGVRQVFGLQFI